MDAIVSALFVLGLLTFFGIMAAVVGTDTRDDFDDAGSYRNYVRPTR